jgi:uncharacterized protein
MKKPIRSFRNLWLRGMVKWRSSPEAIARGAAIGVCVGFLPIFVGQMLCAILLATFLKGNRPASALGTWVSNPVTMPPIYLFTYRLGARILGAAVNSQNDHRLMQTIELLYGPDKDFAAFLRSSMNMGAHTALSLVVGGLIAGLIAAFVSYPVILLFGRRLHEYRLRRRHLFARKFFSGMAKAVNLETHDTHP